jgi:NAD(P)-dependent dehydrogenase (short-subunit alcohol dehydrogenase family)
MHTRLNPVALVTGAASGIGAACARSLCTYASGGLIMVDGDEAALAAAADALPSPPERISTLAFDATDAMAWKRAQDFIRNQYGRLDWAVAGVDAETITEETLPRATLGVAHAVTPLMSANIQGGAVVLALAPHSATLDALLQLVRVAAKEGGAQKVRVNAVINGAVESALWRRDPHYAELLKEARDEIGVLDRIHKDAIPLVRCGAEQDVLRLIRLLLADDSAVSGVTLAVDAAPAL